MRHMEMSISNKRFDKFLQGKKFNSKQFNTLNFIKLWDIFESLNVQITKIERNIFKILLKMYVYLR